MVHLEQQKAQHAHDVMNGDGTWERPKPDRMKLYGLRLSRIVGRMAGLEEASSRMQALAGEAYAVALSSANMLNVDLDRETAGTREPDVEAALFLRLADEVGKYADAAEKLDHLEEFVGQMKAANVGVVRVLHGGFGDGLSSLVEKARSREAAALPPCSSATLS